jgi:hypothetical protein
VRQQELLKQEEETKIAEELKEQERLAQETNEAEEATKLATEEEESHNHDEGTLRVHLIEAHLTHDTEVVGKMDPYIKMHSRE